MPTRIVEVRQNVLKKNDELARALRQRFEDSGVTVVNLVSSPGSGKTAFLQSVLHELHKKYSVAALVGDLATDNDAQRLAATGAKVKQITTGTVCHLDAEMIAAALADWQLTDIDFLLIENVGNLVCPASYDLGERMRMVLLSVTEGEDKPLKYPTIFNTADLAVITKMDLAIATDFDRELAHHNIHEVRPGLEIIDVSARTGTGMQEILQKLEALAADATSVTV